MCLQNASFISEQDQISKVTKFQNKYRIASARLQSWDYRWAAIYFITICTQNREHYFGTIDNEGIMRLSNVGVIADILWREIPNHSRNVKLGSFVVMPNHIHGILILPENDDEIVETGHALSLLQHTIIPTKTIGQSRFQNIGKNSVSSIVGSYKSAVTKHTNRLDFDFKWQSRFHDHIIQNDAAYSRITDYINTNPENWTKDRFF